MKIALEFKKLYHRDLEGLKKEIIAYGNEEDLWLLRGEIKNTAGNLAMHLCGNLQYFIGTVLADTGYVRDRDFEFSGRISKTELLEEIEKTMRAVDSYFEGLSAEELEGEYPLEVFGFKMSVFYFITHLQGHLNYHLGQVNYHRRILAK